MLNIINNKQTLYGIDNYASVIDNVIKTLNVNDYYFDIKLILTEALLNAFEHGNNSDKTKPIDLISTFDGKCIMFEIVHYLSNSKNIKIPNNISDENLLEEHGRGLFLIKSLSDTVEFKYNSLIIKKYILNCTA